MVISCQNEQTNKDLKKIEMVSYPNLHVEKSDVCLTLQYFAEEEQLFVLLNAFFPHRESLFAKPEEK